MVDDIFPFCRYLHHFWCGFSVRFSFCRDGGGCGGIVHLMDIFIQEKEGPEGSERKTFEIETPSNWETGSVGLGSCM
jgi:hypothetical protein